MSEPSPAEILLDHIMKCTDAKAAVVVDGNADEVISRMMDAGWILDERVDIIEGKRIRFLTVPGAWHV